MAKQDGTSGIGFSISLSCFAFEWLFALFLNVVGVHWLGFVPELMLFP